MKKLNLIVILMLLTAMTMVLNNCGYRLSGFSQQIPEYIKSIAIPDFENKTTRFQADQYITFAVKEEFIKRSKLVLRENADSADSLLEGKIMKFTVKPISYSENATANVYKITIVISVRFIDLTNNDIIFEGSDISFSDTYSLDTGEEETDDFFAQETDALLEIAEEFAASVVTTILENF